MILDEIAAATRKRVERCKYGISLEEMKNKAYSIEVQETFPFEERLGKDGIRFICEIKKASPSKGVIDEAFPYVHIAKEYEEAGADCMSVLTEPDYFMGSARYLEEIHEMVGTPLLRKDFTVDAYMIYEAKVIGASAVLLICSLLDEDTLHRWIRLCDRLGLSALVEAHDKAEIGMAVRAGARIIGINNRDLTTFRVDVENGIRLREYIPENILFVAESGIHTRADIEALEKVGTDGVLIGEALMRSQDKKVMLRELRGYGGGNEN